MSDYVAGKGWKQEKYDRIVKAGFGIFAERGIEAVQMTEVAEAAGVGRTTLFRYFPTKTELVVAIATRKWKEFIDWHNSLLSAEEMQRLTGAQYLKFFVDSFLELYRHHKDILRFNYEFNDFVRGAERGSACEIYHKQRGQQRIHHPARYATATFLQPTV